MYRPSTQRIAAAAKALDAISTATHGRPPPWVTVALEQLPDGDVVVDEKEWRKRLGAIWESLNVDHQFSQTEHWVEGWTPPPFWAEGRTKYC